MNNEYGPHDKRKTCKMYVKWVELAGGRVRGRSSKDDEDAKRAADIAAKGKGLVALENMDQVGYSHTLRLPLMLTRSESTHP